MRKPTETFLLLVLFFLMPTAGLLADPSTAAVQKALIEHGHTRGKPDGLMGPRTVAAIRDFQKAQGLPATGVLDGETSKRLGLSEVLSDSRLEPSDRSTDLSSTAKSAVASDAQAPSESECDSSSADLDSGRLGLTLKTEEGAFLFDPEGEGRVMHGNGAAVTGTITYRTVAGQKNTVPYRMLSASENNSIASNLIVYEVPPDKPLLADPPRQASTDGEVVSNNCLIPQDAHEVSAIRKLVNELEAKGIRQVIIVSKAVDAKAPEKVAVSGTVIDVFGEYNTAIMAAMYAYARIPNPDMKKALQAGGLPKKKIDELIKARERARDTGQSARVLPPSWQEAFTSPKALAALSALDPHNGQFVITGTPTPLDRVIALAPTVAGPQQPQTNLDTRPANQTQDK